MFGRSWVCRVCLCVGVCMYRCVRMYRYVCVDVCVGVCAPIRRYVCVDVCVGVCACIGTCVWMCV